jgi:glycosyltransferase involved in cell wall biosynthesis
MSNILFLASYYPNRNEPLKGPFMRRHAQAIALYNNVCVLTSEKATGLGQPFTLDFQVENDVPTMRVYYNLDVPNIPILRNIMRFWRFFYGILRGYFFLKKQYGAFDKVHLNVIHPCGIVALWLKQFEKLPFILTEHSTVYMGTEFYSLSRFNRWIHRQVLKSASEITVVSKIQGKAIQEHAPNLSFKVIPNVIDTDNYKINLLKLSAKDGIKRLVHISNLVDWKGLDAILAALSIISKQRKDFSLDIIGGSNERIEFYQNLCKALDLPSDLVVFHGSKDEKTLATMLPNYDFMVLNSLHETFCVVMVEAFASGLPVLAPACGAIPENLNKERGLLMPNRDVETLVEYLLKMLDTVNNYEPNDIRQFVLDNFTPRIIGKQFDMTYNVS